MKTVVLYGSTLGNCSDSAEQIGRHIETSSVANITDFDFENLHDYDLIVLGSSTWGSGELQDDWAERIDLLRGVDLTGKRVALFGTGDQYSYGDTFVDAMRDLYDTVLAQGAEIIGRWSTEGYDFSESRAVIDNEFVGLALDEDNQAELSAARIEQWVSTLI